MIIGIANDHKGYKLKLEIIKYLKSLDFNIKNYGTDNEESTDYPKYAFMIGEAINKEEIDLGILICHTGIGMSIAANKIKNIRCARVETKEEAFLTRSHNNSNIIALRDSLDIEEVKKIIKTFIETPFSNEERHIRRIEMIKEYES